MTETDFYGLSRAVQDNLLDSMTGQYTPAPLLVRAGPRRRVLLWLVVALVSGFALAILAGAGYGDVDSPLALPPMAFVGIYAGLAGLALAAAFRAAGLRNRAQELPFGPGIFVFPACLVDARDARLKVRSLADLSSVSARGGDVVLAFGGASYSFPPAIPGDPASSVRAVEAAKLELAAADEETRQKLDPLVVPSVASPLTPDVARTRSAPAWERFGFFIGAAAGILVGAGLFFLRDAGSDAKCLAWAKAMNDVPSYEKYLARGRRHGEQVSKELLPRAALKKVVAAGTVEAIDDFSKAHPGTKIQPEIDAARESAIAAELKRAEKAATFVSVLGFGEKYPEKAKDPAFVAAKHALYARALERYLKTTNGDVHDTVKRLVAFAEKVAPKKGEAGYRGAVGEIKVRRIPSKDIDRSDDLIRKSPMFNGVSSLVSTYLDDPHLIPREKALADGIAKVFNAAFDPEIFSFEPKTRLEDGDGKLPAVTVPTIFVSYRVESSGAALAAKKPRGIFLGLTFHFSIELVVPAETASQKSATSSPDPLRGPTKMASTERIPQQVLKDASPTAAAGTIEAACYDEMTRHSFEDLREKYASIWFKKH